MFEVLSPGNTSSEMMKKRRFYHQYGAEEYYIIDPETNGLEIWIREGEKFVGRDPLGAFISPRLGIKFDLSGPELVLCRPNGERFQTFLELETQVKTERQRANRAEQRANKAESEVDRLAAKLRAAGIDPEAP